MCAPKPLLRIPRLVSISRQNDSNVTGIVNREIAPTMIRAGDLALLFLRHVLGELKGLPMQYMATAG
jgi:hypothetical protein